MRKRQENDLLRLLHMRDAAKYARQFVSNETRQTFDEDIQLQFALARAVQIVGEAACHVTAEFQAKHPQIAWKQIMGMRQFLVHAYFKTDLDVLWKTAVEDLPFLIAQLEAILPSEDLSK